MARVPKKTKRTKKPHKKALKTDIEELEKDCEKVIKDKELVEDQKFMTKLAEDIKKLNEDAQACEEVSQLDPSVHMIHHMIATPWGAPFVTDKTLLEAAVSFEFQDLSQSDLSHIMLDLRNYNSIGESQMLIVLDSIHEELED